MIRTTGANVRWRRFRSRRAWTIQSPKSDAGDRAFVRAHRWNCRATGDQWEHSWQALGTLAALRAVAPNSLRHELVFKPEAVLANRRRPERMLTPYDHQRCVHGCRGRGHARSRHSWRLPLSSRSWFFRLSHTADECRVFGSDVRTLPSPQFLQGAIARGRGQARLHPFRPPGRLRRLISPSTAPRQRQRSPTGLRRGAASHRPLSSANRCCFSSLRRFVISVCVEANAADRRPVIGGLSPRKAAVG